MPGSASISLGKISTLLKVRGGMKEGELECYLQVHGCFSPGGHSPRTTKVEGDIQKYTEKNPHILFCFFICL